MPYPPDLSHGGVEVSSLPSYVGEQFVGSHRESKDRSQLMVQFLQGHLVERDLTWHRFKQFQPANHVPVRLLDMVAITKI